MGALRERLPVVVAERTINCASIQAGYVKFEESQGKRLVALAQDNCGNWYMWTEIYASELIYRKRMTESPESVNQEKWVAKRGIYKGGLGALNSDIGEAKEELNRLQREYPDFNSSEIVLGTAIELTDESLLVYHHDDYGLWMELGTGGDVKIAVLLDERKIDFSSRSLPESRKNALSIGF